MKPFLMALGVTFAYLIIGVVLAWILGNIGALAGAMMSGCFFGWYNFFK